LVIETSLHYDALSEKHKKNICMLQCASHVCYGQQIKFVCVTVHRTRNSKTCGVGFMRLPLNLPPSIGNF